ncbi:MAG: hypothetical protein DRJ35_03315 [Thermoprotei archaeon]|nr:MAG: hypothetical protein DRJ35_03315 [Thermoprotei archaeon]
MPKRAETLDKKLLYLFYVYGKALSKKRVHELVYLLQEKYGVKLGFKFYGNPPLSMDLDERLSSLVEKGYLKVLYVVGENYLTLYKPYYKLTEKGEKIAEKKDFAKTDMKKINQLVEDVKQKKVSGIVSKT